MSFFDPNILNNPLEYERAKWIAGCCTVSACTIVLYDHLCTLPDEVRYIWSSKLNSVTLLFHLNRWSNTIYALIYLSMLSIPESNKRYCFFNLLHRVYVDISESLPHSSSCTILNHLQQACTAIEFVVWAALSALRVYAVTRGKLWLAATVVVLAFIPGGTNFYSVFIVAPSSPKAVSDPACFTATYIAESTGITSADKWSGTHRLAGAIITRFGVIVFDFVVLLIIWQAYWSETVVYTFCESLIGYELRTLTLPPIISVLMSINIIQIIGIFTNDESVATEYFRNPLSTIILSHFLLNLRSAAHHSLDDSVDSQRTSFIHISHRERAVPRSQAAGIRFASFVANIGEDLVHGTDPGDTETDLMIDTGTADEDVEMISMHDLPSSDSPPGLRPSGPHGMQIPEATLVDILY
ncbi:hypothetical protein CERSUDRAFT_97095 [Gelatoporia subvermispora B]|uniref:DUF6533 domain-containing protein n=1 Tax=Ceriporiopsis subvermispora (strain B) TaxID=914234 RepID=M2R9P4_CERS8|nr:hypothetical protein CERSUDRAFT_97095 [Gelatoporia subvermispora B]